MMKQTTWIALCAAAWLGTLSAAWRGLFYLLIWWKGTSWSTGSAAWAVGAEGTLPTGLGALAHAAPFLLLLTLALICTIRVIQKRGKHCENKTTDEP